jgi:hypothetical protein
MNSLVRTLCALLAAAVALPAVAAGKPCELKQVTAMEVAVAPDGSVLVPVALEGHPGFMALQLDAGSPWLFPGYVEELGLQKATHGVVVDARINGRKVDRQLRVKSTRLGLADFTGWEYMVLPESPTVRPKFRGYPVYGTMSSVFMSAVDMELNLAENRIALFRPNRCSSIPVYWEGEVTAVPLYTDRSGLMIFPMEVEGNRVETSLNTTSRMSVLFTKLAKRYLGFDANSPGIERQTLPGGREVASFRAVSLTAKGLGIHNARVRLSDFDRCDPTSSGKDTGAIGCRDMYGLTPFSIGTDLLKQLRIYASVVDGKIYFTRVGLAAAPAADAQPVAGSDANSAPGAAN